MTSAIIINKTIVLSLKQQVNSNVATTGISWELVADALQSTLCSTAIRLSGNLRAMLDTVLYADVDITGSLIYLLSTRWFELLDYCCLCTASFLY
jgi:hypothetical protein